MQSLSTCFYVLAGKLQNDIVHLDMRGFERNISAFPMDFRIGGLIEQNEANT